MVIAASSFVVRPGPALADANEVSISPGAIEVAPGGAVTVQLVADPPVGTLSIWAIDVVFDPDVVTTSSRDCDTLDPPADSTMIGLCVVEDEDGDGVVETLTVLGGLVFNDGSGGLKERTVLADITFTIVGSPGACTDLRLRVRIHADEEGETDPLLFDGIICVEQDAPPSGTAVPHTPAPRTSEPTPTGGGGPTLPSLGGVGGGPDSAGETAGSGETPTNGGETPAGGTQGASPSDSASQTQRPGESGEGGGGDSALIWALIIMAGLIAAGGVAWAVVRRRGAGSGPEGGPSAG
ncbi:MAG: hypothetical protein J4O14_06270 [Chloroflexi bacterium]|nr:hypothetical protein [Chloroflexota bacterium]